MNKETIQSIRDLTRPILTYLFSFSYVIGILATLGWLLFLKEDTSLEMILAVLGLLGTPVGMMLTYHFMKKSLRDGQNKEKEIQS